MSDRRQLVLCDVTEAQWRVKAVRVENVTGTSVLGTRGQPAVIGAQLGLNPVLPVSLGEGLGVNVLSTN